MDSMDDLTRIKSQAQRWVVDLADEDLTEAEEIQFREWINSSPSHEEIFLDSQAVWSNIGQMDHLVGLTSRNKLLNDISKKAESTNNIHTDEPETSLSELIHHKVKSWFWVPASAIVLFATLWFIPGTLEKAPEYRIYTTQKAEINNISLEDGTSLVLGAKSTVRVMFNDSQRNVELMNGEAFFNVAKNPNRPFYVTAKDIAVRVLGTQFNVYKGRDKMRVSVKEGVVELLTTEAAPTHSMPAEYNSVATLTAGRQITTSYEGKILIDEQIEIDAPGAWRYGRLDYHEVPLREVLEDANRYYSGDITIADESIAELVVTASFRSGRIDQMIDTLTLALPIEATRTPYGSIILKKRVLEKEASSQ